MKKEYKKMMLVIRYLDNVDIVSSSGVDDENIGWIPWDLNGWTGV